MRIDHFDHDIPQFVKDAAGKKLFFLPHSVRQISRPDRMISVSEVRNGVLRGEVIEDYPGMSVASAA